MSGQDKNSAIDLDMNKICRTATIIVSFIGLYLINQMMYIRENYHKDAKPAFESFSYHLPRMAFWSIIVSIGRAIIQYITQDFAIYWYMKTTTKNTEVYKDKIKPVISNLIWYSFITTFGYIYVAYNNKIVPKTLGGSKEYDEVCSKNYPYLDMREIDYLYFHVQFGSKIYSLFKTILFEREFADFWEMFLHHLVSILLMILCLFSNVTEVGLIVLLIHDPGDVALNLMKIYRYVIPKAYKPTIFTIIISVSSVVFWILPRVGIQPFSLFSRILTFLMNIRKYSAYEIDDSILSSLLILMSSIFAVLLILYFMNLYWSMFALRVVASFLFKGEFQYHHGAKITKAEKEKEKKKKDKGKKEKKLVKNKID